MKELWLEGKWKKSEENICYSWINTLTVHMYWNGETFTPYIVEEYIVEEEHITNWKTFLGLDNNQCLTNWYLKDTHK